MIRIKCIVKCEECSRYMPFRTAFRDHSPKEEQRCVRCLDASADRNCHGERGQVRCGQCGEAGHYATTCDFRQESAAMEDWNE